MSTRPPIRDKVTGLRQRRRADGTWRVWWEPNTPQRQLGHKTVELDADRPTWSVAQAKKLARSASKGVAQGKPLERARAGARTISALISAYETDELPRKKPATQAGYRGWLSIIDAKWGTELARDLTGGMMYRWGRALQRDRGETQAKRVIAVMSILMSYAERIDWRPKNSNPCFRLGLEVPDPRQRMATPEEVEAIEAASERLAQSAISAEKAELWRRVADAVRLSLFQAQRQEDVRAAKLGDFSTFRGPDGNAVWVWKFTRSKRQNEGGMEVHPENVALIERRWAETDNPSDHLLPGRNGFWKQDEFQKDWAAVRAEAAKRLPTCATLQFRDLRRTGAVWSRQGGASKSDVGDLMGNSAGQNARLATTYMPETYETSSRAIRAIRRPPSTKRDSA